MPGRYVLPKVPIGNQITDLNDVKAHVVLTDGQTSNNLDSPLDSKVVTLYKDASEVDPDKIYYHGEFPYFGLNYPSSGVLPGSSQHLTLNSIGVKGHRFETSWQALQYRRDSINEIKEQRLNLAYCTSECGGSVLGLICYTPRWAAEAFSGDEKFLPPAYPIERTNGSGELLDFSNGDTVQLSHYPVIYSTTPTDASHNINYAPFVVTENPPNLVETGPVVLGRFYNVSSTRLPLPHGGIGDNWGFVQPFDAEIKVQGPTDATPTTWTQVNDILEAGTSTCYELYRDGYVCFSPGYEAYQTSSNGKPADGSTISATSYKYIDKSSVYVKGVDYDLNPITGEVTKLEGSRIGSNCRVFYSYFDDYAWKNWVQLIISNTCHMIKHYEVWNEPAYDGGPFWAGGYDLAGYLAKSAKEVVQGIDPSIRIVGPGMDDTHAGLYSEMYEKVSGFKESTNELSWHPYIFYDYDPQLGNWDGSPQIPGSTNQEGRKVMLDFSEAKKKVFLGELTATAQILTSMETGSSMGLASDRIMKMLMMSRRLGWCKGVQYYPGKDQPGTEESPTPATPRDGLYYSDGTTRKPQFEILKSAASNKGFLVDLVNYPVESHTPSPIEKGYTLNSVSISGKNLGTTNTKIYISKTAASSGYVAPQVNGRLYNNTSFDYVFSVSVADNVGLKEGAVWWTAEVEALAGPTPTFAVKQDGIYRGVATAGAVYADGIVTFTPPDKSYSVGNRLIFETFKGDGWKQVSGNWVVGTNRNTLNFTSNEFGRYVNIEFGKDNPSENIVLDEIFINDSSNTNVALNKYYLLSGFEKIFTPSSMKDIPGLALWLNASDLSGLSDNAKIENWEDSGCLKNVASQLSSDYQPTFQSNAINGHPAVKFDGVDDYFELAEELHRNRRLPSDRLTIFAVVQPAIDDADQCLIFSRGNFDPEYPNSQLQNQAMGVLKFGINSDGDAEIYGQRTNFGSNFRLDGPSVGTNPVIIQYWINEQEATARAGAHSKESTSASLPEYNHKCVTTLIGNGISLTAHDLDSPFNGLLAELLVFDGILNKKYEDTVRNYLQNKYGLTLAD